jgi:hypothetical protein
MKKLYDLAIVKDSYTNKNGEQKAVWQNIGTLMEGDKGNRFIFLDRTFNPAGIQNPENRSNIIISLFPPKKDGDGSGNVNELEKDIPF